MTWFTHFKNDLSRDLLRILSYVESFSLGWFGFQNVTLPLFPLSEFQFVTVRKKASGPLGCNRSPKAGVKALSVC